MKAGDFDLFWLDAVAFAKELLPAALAAVGGFIFFEFADVWRSRLRTLVVSVLFDSGQNA